MPSREVPCDECGTGVLTQDAVLIASGKDGNVYQCLGCADADQDELLTEAVAEEAAEPECPFGLTPEAEIVAQSKDPVDFDELDWHIVSPQANPGKPDDECELGSCVSEATHHVELLSGKLFFGCSTHVDALVSMRVASKKRQFV